jgi:hypothetical protein
MSQQNNKRCYNNRKGDTKTLQQKNKTLQHKNRTNEDFIVGDTKTKDTTIEEHDK